MILDPINCSWLGSRFARNAICLLALLGLRAMSQDVTFKDEVATFTNLQGQVYQRVHLVRGDKVVSFGVTARAEAVFATPTFILTFWNPSGFRVIRLKLPDCVRSKRRLLTPGTVPGF